MSRTSAGWWWVLAPVPVGIAGAVAIGAAAPDLEAYLVMPLSWFVLVVAAACSALVAGIVLARRGAAVAAQRAAHAVGQNAHAERLRFLMRLDHELKNPLTAVRAGLANLAAAADLAEPDRRTVSSVDDQAVRLSRLLVDLRKLAELESRPVERRPVDIGEVLGDVEAAVRELPEAAERVLRLTLPRAPWPLPPIPGDRDLLFVAVHNLATNALKFTAPGDTVEFRGFEEGDRVVVEVADTGQGIPEDEQGQVWAELARGRQARGIPGSGLGLAMVRTVIALHGGTTVLRSREGHGTVVRLALPTG